MSKIYKFINVLLIIILSVNIVACKKNLNEANNNVIEHNSTEAYETNSVYETNNDVSTGESSTDIIETTEIETTTSHTEISDVEDTTVAVEEETTTQDKIEYTVTQLDKVMYAKSSVNVRKGPSKDFDKVGSLSTGKQVKVVGQSDQTGWYLIQFDGKEGYVSNSYLQDTPVETIVSKPTTETMTEYEEETVAKLDNKTDELVRNILKKIITPNMSEFEKALVIHDWMAINIRYDVENYINDTVPRSSYTAEGALTNGVAVCDGYAKAFELLAEKAGLEVNYVWGEANNGEWGGHAWNQVKIDGKWYNVDVTWDDPITIYGANDVKYDDNWNVYYDYFLVSDTKLNENHKCLSDKNSCNESYDRQKIYSYAVKSGLFGENIFYAKSQKELIEYIDMLGDNDIKDTMCIWYDNSSGEVYNLNGANYPIEIKESAYVGGLVRQYFSVCMTKTDFNNYPVIIGDDDLTDLIVDKFDSGLDSFCVIILDDGDNALSIYGGRYAVELERIVGFSYGKNALYKVIKTGIGNPDYVTKSEVKDLVVIYNLQELIKMAENQLTSGIDNFKVVYKYADNGNQLVIPDGYNWTYDICKALDNGDIVIKISRFE